MEVFHRCSAEDDEKTHPQGGALEGDGLIGLSLFGLVIRLEDHCVEKECEEAQHEQKLDHEDHEIFGVVLHSIARLGDQNLIHIMKVDSSGKEEDDQ